MNRRRLLTIAAVGPLLQATEFDFRSASRTKAIAFDGFTVFDPLPIGARAEGLFLGKAVELTPMWRTRQFGYTWLRVLMGSYRDFWSVTEDPLVYSAKMLKLQLSGQGRQSLMRL